MSRLLLLIPLLAYGLVLSGQTYYVALVKGEVYYNDQPLRKQDKITLSGTLRFSSADDYIKVSGPGGLHTVQPEGVRPNRRNEFLVAVRQELFPAVRVRATVANNYVMAPFARYFNLNGSSKTSLLPSHYHLDTTRQREAEEFGLLHATPQGLVWQSLPLDNGWFTIDSTTFRWPVVQRGVTQIDSTAVVLVRDSLAWQVLIQNHQDIRELRDSVDEFIEYYDRIVEAPPSVEFDSLTGEWREVLPAAPPPKPAEVLDYLRPFHFVDPILFLEDMRFHIQQTGARNRDEFMHDYFFDQYIEEEYGNPEGLYEVVDALVPEPYVSNAHFLGDWSERPLRVGVVGLVHTHVHWLLGREERGDIEIVGIAEPNRELAERFCRQHGLSFDLIYDGKEALMAYGRPEAVTGFNTTYDHLALVEYFAPRRVHIMVEKPLAVNLADAERMVALAREHKVHLLTNYETSWYGSNAYARELLRDSSRLGALTRLVFYTGHQGPIEIGCNDEFLEWLTDPVLNGGGALPDFACYGANLATWLLQGAEPLDVTCITRQTKPELYPKVEDDAVIILNYPDEVQVIIQASWNWSHNRKEMELYAADGYVFCRDGQRVEQLLAGLTEPERLMAEPLPEAVNDPFAYLFAVVKKGQAVDPWDVSAPENNLRVMQILEAAKWSAEEGRTVRWDEFLRHWEENR